MCAIKTSQNELYGKYPCWRCLRKYTNVHSMNVNVVVCFLSAFFALRHSLDLWVHPTDRHEVITHFFTLPVSIMHYSKYSMERRPTCKCNARLLTIHIIWFDRFDERRLFLCDCQHWAFTNLTSAIFMCAVQIVSFSWTTSGRGTLDFR